MKYYIGPKIQKWTEIPPHEIYIRKILMADSRSIFDESKINIKEIKSNVSFSFYERTTKIFEVCQKEMSKNKLLQDSNKLHG